MKKSVGRKKKRMWPPQRVLPGRTTMDISGKTGKIMIYLTASREQTEASQEEPVGVSAPVLREASCTKTILQGIICILGET